MKKQHLEKIEKLRKDLHQNPELSMKETWTKAHLMHFLRRNTSLELIDCGSWFYGAYRNENSKESIAFRADFDAVKMEECIDLPYASINKGVAHKCGHDGHAATLAGLALEVCDEEPDKNVFFLFQPGEETAEGAIECKEFIAKEKIDEIYAYHNISGVPKGSINVIDGLSNFSSLGMIISMEGVPTHASMPELGINPAYAISKLVSSLQEVVEEQGSSGLLLVTVIQINIGEKAFGIAASKGELLLTLRGEEEKELFSLKEALESYIRVEGKKEGLRVKIMYQDVFPETRNHKESSDKVRLVAKDKGLQVIEREEASRGSEDFGHYLKETKGALIYIGNGEEYPQIHTSEYDFPDDIMETAVELFKGLIYQKK